MSNVLPVDEVLLAQERHVPLPIDHRHPWPTGPAIAGDLGPSWCAEEYAREVRAALPLDPAGLPIFDLVLLGIGPDGHLLSVFPGSPAIGSDHLALGIAAPEHVEPHLPRVTLNPSILSVARAILVMAAGSGKAGILARILDGPRLDPADPAVCRPSSPGGRRRPGCSTQPRPPSWTGRRADPAGMTRDGSGFVRSSDGTSIAWFRIEPRTRLVIRPGRRPALILVHGATADHSAFRAVGPTLAERRAVDRDRSARPGRQRGPAAVRDRA